MIGVLLILVLIRFKVFAEDREDIQNYKLMIVFITCHGAEGDILLPVDADEENAEQDGIPVKYIAEKFHKMKNMRGKPKILIIEACRGNEFNSCELVERKTVGIRFKQMPVAKEEVRLIFQILYREILFFC